MTTNKQMTNGKEIQLNSKRHGNSNTVSQPLKENLRQDLHSHFKKKLVKQKHEGQLTCGRYTCVGGSVAQLALAAASAALASAGKVSETKEGFIN